MPNSVSACSESARLGRLVLVDDRLDQSGRERAPAGQLEQPEALAALDDDVHAAVVQLVEDLRHPRPRADLVHGTVARREHESELDALLEALADQLAVAVFEDVERNPLRRDEDERQRKESQRFRHGCSLRVRGHESTVRRATRCAGVAQSARSRDGHVTCSALRSRWGGGRERLAADPGQAPAVLAPR